MEREEIEARVGRILSSHFKIGLENAKLEMTMDELGAVYMSEDYNLISSDLIGEFGPSMYYDSNEVQPAFVHMYAGFINRPDLCLGEKRELTGLGVEKFKKDFPHIDSEKIKVGMPFEELTRLDTIRSLVDFVEQRLGAVA